MSTILAAVGRAAINRTDDVRVVQGLLNQHLQPPQRPLAVDGVVGPQTIAAIEDFQRRVVKMNIPDGRVDPGGRTFTALTHMTARSTPPGTGLPAVCSAAPLTEDDCARAARTLGCEMACIRAVMDVESGARGFLASGRPTILFEAHIFSRQTQHQYDGSHPSISSRTWNRALYKGGEREYERLAEAMVLHRTAALSSASWGRFQIMGLNYQRAGFESVEAFVEAMFESEGRQLAAFVRFLQHQQLDAPLRQKRWADFARGYNGSGYAENQYDTRLKAAYETYSRA